MSKASVTTKDVINRTADKAKDVVDKAKDVVDKAKDDSKGVVEKGTKSTKDVTARIGQKIEEAGQHLKDKGD